MNYSSKERRPQTKIRILIINPYQLIQQSLRLLIEHNSDMMVSNCLSQLTDEDEPVLKTISPPPDVVLIYLADGYGDTIEKIPLLRKQFPEIRIIVVASGKDSDHQLRALEMGAVGIVQKEQNTKILIESIRQTYRGESWINQALLSRLLKGNAPGGANNSGKDPSGNGGEFAGANVEVLTSRERDVITLIGEGLKNKEIALRLRISEATVRHHLSSIYGKLNVADRLNLVIHAYQHGLIFITAAGKSAGDENGREGASEVPNGSQTSTSQ